MYTKEYIQGGSTSVQRHPLPFRWIYFCSEAPLLIEGIHLRRSRSMFLLVSTNGSPSYLALGCSELLACEYSVEHGVTFDPECPSCRNVRRRLVYQKLEPASVYDFWVYLPNKSSMEVRMPGLEKCRALTLAAFVKLYIKPLGDASSLESNIGCFYILGRGENTSMNRFLLTYIVP